MRRARMVGAKTIKFKLWGRTRRKAHGDQRFSLRKGKVRSYIPEGAKVEGVQVGRSGRTNGGRARGRVHEGELPERPNVVVLVDFPHAVDEHFAEPFH